MHFSWAKTPFPGQSECFVAVLLTLFDSYWRCLNVFLAWMHSVVECFYPFLMFFFIKVKNMSFMFCICELMFLTSMLYSVTLRNTFSSSEKAVKTHLYQLAHESGSPAPLNLVLTGGIMALCKCAYLLTYLLSLNFCKGPYDREEGMCYARSLCRYRPLLDDIVAMLIHAL